MCKYYVNIFFDGIHVLLIIILTQYIRLDSMQTLGTYTLIWELLLLKKYYYYYYYYYFLFFIIIITIRPNIDIKNKQTHCISEFNYLLHIEIFYFNKQTNTMFWCWFFYINMSEVRKKLDMEYGNCHQYSNHVVC